MPLWLKLIKQISKVLAALLGVIVGLYIILLLINLQDQPASVAAITMQQLQQRVKPEAEQTSDNNGYLFLIEHENQPEIKVSDQLFALMRECNLADCNKALMAYPDLEDMLGQHQLLIDFYLQLKGFSNWYEPVPTDPAHAIPSFRALLNAQQLVFMQAWLAAQQQDAATVQQLLQQDMQFWRSLLPKHNLLINKMISAAAIKRHFSFANAIRQQLEPQQHIAMLPSSWLTPFSTEELSLLQVLSGEWVYGNASIDQAFAMEPAAYQRTFSEQLEWWLFTPLYQKQATRNQRASLLLADISGEKPPQLAWYSWLYNPVGQSLNIFAQPDYSLYQRRLEELEPLRQQSLTLTEFGAEL